MSVGVTPARVAVLIPALNCAGTVVAVVLGAGRYVPEVLVVDDGSTDDTGARARAAGGRVAHWTSASR